MHHASTEIPTDLASPELVTDVVTTIQEDTFPSTDSLSTIPVTEYVTVTDTFTWWGKCLSRSFDSGVAFKPLLSFSISSQA